MKEKKRKSEASEREMVREGMEGWFEKRRKKN